MKGSLLSPVCRFRQDILVHPAQGTHTLRWTKKTGVRKHECLGFSKLTTTVQLLFRGAMTSASCYNPGQFARYSRSEYLENNFNLGPCGKKKIKKKIPHELLEPESQTWKYWSLRLRVCLPEGSRTQYCHDETPGRSQNESIIEMF